MRTEVMSHMTVQPDTPELGTIFSLASQKLLLTKSHRPLVLDKDALFEEM